MEIPVVMHVGPLNRKMQLASPKVENSVEISNNIFPQ